MKTRIVAVDPERPDAGAIGDAAKLLVAGKLVAFPTETVYGLGANALDVDAVRRIFEAKGRPPTNPVIVHVSSIEQARGLCAGWSDGAAALAEAFWPGPLTLVVPRGPQIPGIVSAGLDTFGVRMPAHPVALALIAAAGVPVAAPSANRYTQVSPTSAAHVAQSLGDRLEMILDGGSTEVGIESTVVRLDPHGVTLLRPGHIGLEELQRVAGPVTRAIGEHGEDVARQSPGQSVRHYAPRARVEVGGWGEVDISGAKTPGALLLHSAAAPEADFVVRMPDTPGEYARRLYAAFWEADAAGCDVLVVEPPPAIGAWEAVLDRLSRAQTRG